MKIKLTADMRMRLAHAEELDITDIVAPIFAERDALSQKLRAAQHEAEALAATVEALSSKLKEVAALVDGDGFSAIQWILDNHAEVGQLAFATPQQHLREVRAEAGRAGFVAGCMYADDIFDSYDSQAADNYAESVKAGDK